MKCGEILSTCYKGTQSPELSWLNSILILLNSSYIYSHKLLSSKVTTSCNRKVITAGKMSTAHNDPQAPLEKDFSQQNGNGAYTNGQSYLNDDMDHESALKRIRTAGSISISPELFEKIYLSPQNKVKGDLRKTFGNPTPL